ncbi:MAG TPA: MarC family protein, partial [Steroidobacteraceae bacterium]|nr:MarC family protein [Steroidobacteraceae bacterium]
MIQQLVKFFVVFFVVVEPISLIPLFAGLTEGAGDGYKRLMAGKAAAISLGICILFALVGAKFLHVMGISLNSFRIAGGTLLFLISLDMVFARTSGTRST